MKTNFMLQPVICKFYFKPATVMPLKTARPVKRGAGFAIEHKDAVTVYLSKIMKLL